MHWHLFWQLYWVSFCHHNKVIVVKKWWLLWCLVACEHRAIWGVIKFLRLWSHQLLNTLKKIWAHDFSQNYITATLAVADLQVLYTNEQQIEIGKQLSVWSPFWGVDCSRLFLFHWARQGFFWFYDTLMCNTNKRVPIWLNNWLSFPRSTLLRESYVSSFLLL